MSLPFSSQSSLNILFKLDQEIPVTLKSYPVHLTSHQQTHLHVSLSFHFHLRPPHTKNLINLSQRAPWFNHQIHLRTDSDLCVSQIIFHFRIPLFNFSFPFAGFLRHPPRNLHNVKEDFENCFWGSSLVESWSTLWRWN